MTKTYDKRFYNTRLWHDKRDEIKQRDNYECQLCKDRGLVTPATEVHHKLTYESRPDLALDNDNLISLCTACHNEQHGKGFQSVEREIHEERWE